MDVCCHPVRFRREGLELNIWTFFKVCVLSTSALQEGGVELNVCLCEGRAGLGGNPRLSYPFL